MKHCPTLLLALSFILGMTSCNHSTEVVGGKSTPQIDSISYSLYFAMQLHSITYTYAANDSLQNVRNDTLPDAGEWAGMDACTPLAFGDSIRLDGTGYKLNNGSDQYDTSHSMLHLDTINHMLTIRFVLHSVTVEQDSISFNWHFGSLAYTMMNVPYTDSNGSYAVDISNDFASSRISKFSYSDSVRLRATGQNFGGSGKSLALNVSHDQPFHFQLFLHKKQ